MPKNKNYGKCQECGSKLSKNEYGISVKYYGDNGNKLCIKCLAELFNVTADDILDKIEEYKNEGCVLFD
jgi:uncharacterized protein with PIN domain